MGSTKPVGAVETVLEVLWGFALSTGRRLREHLRTLLEGPLHHLLHGQPSTPSADERGPSTTTDEHAARARFGGEHADQHDGHPLAGHGDELPRAYGQARAVLVARDPWWLFVHWEVPPVRRVQTLRSLGADGEGTREVLRVYDVLTGRDFWDIDLESGAERAHVRVERPGRAYRVEVGLRTLTGRFVALVTSNLVTTPPAEPSRDMSVDWVALGRDARPADAPAQWSGRRVPVPQADTALESPAETPMLPEAGSRSSDALPPRPRASDALPLR